MGVGYLLVYFTTLFSFKLLPSVNYNEEIVACFKVIFYILIKKSYKVFQSEQPVSRSENRTRDHRYTKDTW
jgi:hypothetical protein